MPVASQAAMSSPLSVAPVGARLDRLHAKDLLGRDVTIATTFDDVVVGMQADGYINHTAGIFTINKTLDLGDQADSTGTYTLSGGTVAPSLEGQLSTAALHLDSAFSLAANSFLAINLAGPVAGSGYDALTVGGK